MATLKEPQPHDVFQAGQILNNTYEIKGLLGRGGTGEVYLAHHQIVEREMAIKVLNSIFSGNDDYLELMKREEQMRMIINDAVVRYNECSRTAEGHVYLVMDYIDGPSLNDVMADRQLDVGDLMIVAQRVLEGLVATHAQGVVHRDLSPDNIILRKGDPGRATIIDFGIAKDTSAGARTIVGNDFAGKYEYAAPEQLEGTATDRSDLYALGASLLAALRQQVPEVGRSPMEIWRTKQEPLDVSGVPAPLDGLISWLSAPESGARPTSAAEALDHVRNLLETGGETDSPTVVPTPRREAATPSSVTPQAEARASTPPPAHVTGVPKSKPAAKDKADDGKKRSPAVPIAAGLAIAVLIGAGLWLSGLVGGRLPIAAPYRFEAVLGAQGNGSLAGNAPSEEAANVLANAFNRSTGVSVAPDALALARGAPSENWAARVGDLLRLLAPLETFSLALSDSAGQLEGFAPNTTVRNETERRLEAWANAASVALAVDVVAGPLVLTPQDLQPTLDALSTCGRLFQSGNDSGAYALGDTITITGDVASDRDAEALRNGLAQTVGDRNLQVNTTTLNDDLCAIRAVLPPVTGDVVIRLYSGETGERSTTGVFRTGQNPVVDVEVPATMTEGWLWVLVVDNTGKVFHILPIRCSSL